MKADKPSSVQSPKPVATNAPNMQEKGESQMTAMKKSSIQEIQDTSNIIADCEKYQEKMWRMLKLLNNIYSNKTNYLSKGELVISVDLLEKIIKCIFSEMDDNEFTIFVTAYDYTEFTVWVNICKAHEPELGQNGFYEGYNLILLQKLLFNGYEEFLVNYQKCLDSLDSYYRLFRESGRDYSEIGGVLEGSIKEEIQRRGIDFERKVDYIKLT